ncbi:hypothetical protein ACFLQS_03000 [Actinomycetota bacterium]
MVIKKKLTILLIVALSICLFFAFGFQIDVGGFISKDGGNADVSLIGPLTVAADEANTALAAAQTAFDEAQAALTAAQEAVTNGPALVAAAQAAVTAAEATLAGLIPGTPEADAAQVVLNAANAALIAAQEAFANAPAALIAAQAAFDAAETALLAAQAAFDEAQAALVAYAGLKTKANEELEALKLLADEATTAYDTAVAEGLLTPEEIGQLELAAIAANAAVEEFEPGENRLMYSHIVVNSNNGGSFFGELTEGNHTGVDGETLQFTFDSDPGFDLVWLRIGNIKVQATEDILPYLETFNKKNLTIHAHFKKDKDYVPTVVTTEGADPEGDVVPPDEDDDKKGNGKGKDKEKSNNGKKKDK